MCKLCEAVAPLIGRILLSQIFLMSGIHKLTAWHPTAVSMRNEGMPLRVVPWLLLGAVILEIGGGLSVLLGWRARIGAFALIVFLIPTTLIFHDFWTFQGDQQQMQMIHFTKNLAIMGGLCIVLGHGAGCCSVDRGWQR